MTRNSGNDLASVQLHRFRDLAGRQAAKVEIRPTVIHVQPVPRGANALGDSLLRAKSPIRPGAVVRRAVWRQIWSDLFKILRALCRILPQPLREMKRPCSERVAVNRAVIPAHLARRKPGRRFKRVGTPGGNRTCAHGLGNHCSIR